MRLPKAFSQARDPIAMQLRKNGCFLALPLLLAMSASAQAVITAPPGYLSKRGESATWLLGSYAENHFHFGDGTLRGKPFSILRVDLRLDEGRSYGASTGMGRTFTTARLSMAETDITKMTRTWADNRVTDPTLVYSASNVSWPTVSGRVNSATWGSPVGIAFSKPWLYSGSRDLLFEYEFRGGRLANNAAWSRGTFRGYYMDGLTNDTRVSGLSVAVPPSIGRCNDPAMTTTVGAYASGRVDIYGIGPLIPEWQQDKMYVYHWSWYTAPRAPVVQLLSLGGIPAGVGIGAACHKLHVDPNRALGLKTRTTDTRGYSGWADDNGRYWLPYMPNWRGASFWVQAAWANSKTGALSLTAARRFEIPTAKSTPLPRQTVWAWNGNRTLAQAVSAFRGYQTLPRITRR